MKKKIAVVGNDWILSQAIKDELGKEITIASNHTAIFPLYAKPEYIPEVKLGSNKINCTKGHTYVQGKCRCGKDLGFSTL
jgi:hypothetical protein